MNIKAEYDTEGIYVYQAFCEDIANKAVENQTFKNSGFKPDRMTWIKPSFGWMLYRSGYGTKPNQNRVLKIKLSHETFCKILSSCRNKGHIGGSNARVQWDPDRDIWSPEHKKHIPRKMQTKAIQIGVKGPMSEFYTSNILEIKDVTDIAHAIGSAHKQKKYSEEMNKIKHIIAEEKIYHPDIDKYVKERLNL